MDGTDWRLRVRDLLARMGLVAVFLHASSMSTAQIVDVQGQPFTFFGTDFGVPYTETNLARSLGIEVAHRTIRWNCPSSARFRSTSSSAASSEPGRPPPESSAARPPG